MNEYLYVLYNGRINVSKIVDNEICLSNKTFVDNYGIPYSGEKIKSAKVEYCQSERRYSCADKEVKVLPYDVPTYKTLKTLYPYADITKPWDVNLGLKAAKNELLNLFNRRNIDFEECGNFNLNMKYKGQALGIVTITFCGIGIKYLYFRKEYHSLDDFIKVLQERIDENDNALKKILDDFSPHMMKVRGGYIIKDALGNYVDFWDADYDNKSAYESIKNATEVNGLDIISMIHLYSSLLKLKYGKFIELVRVEGPYGRIYEIDGSVKNDWPSRKISIDYNNGLIFECNGKQTNKFDDFISLIDSFIKT